MVAFLIGMLAKVWRAGDLYLEADTLAGFAWLPLGVGAELLVAGVFAGLSALLLDARRKVALVVMPLIIAFEIAWLTLNDVSYRISQIGVTFQRIRGDEGVKVKDFNLMAMGDVYPALWYTAAALVVAGAAVMWRRRHPPFPSRAIIAASVIGAMLYVSDLAVFSNRNFGMAESPVLLFARTYLRAFAGRSEVHLDKTVAAPTTKAERLAMLAAQEPQPPGPTPTRAKMSVKNGVLFFSEGIARRQTGLEGQGTTPNLIAAMNESGALDLENYYTPYHKSIAAIFSMACSDYPPPNAKNIMAVNPRIDCGSLPEVMSENGIHPGLFHGGDFGFYDKLQLLGMRGFEVRRDARSIAGPGVWEHDWGVDDRAAVDAMLAWIDTIPEDERFFAVFIPITAHYPYAIPPDVNPAFPGHAAKNRFYSAVHFLDEAFGRLREGLRARGRLDDTALLYMADHGETVAERPRAQAGRRLAYEPSVHIPFVIIAPEVFTTWQKNGRVGSHVDLVPTIADLMGLPQDSRNHGQSLLSSTFSPRRIFLGANNGPKFIGWLDGKEKFIFNRNTGLQELYNLNTDPFEQRNIADDEPAKVTRLTGEVLAFYDGQLKHLKDAPRVAGEVDVQDGLLAYADVSVVKPDGTVVECPPDPASLGDDADLSIDGFDKLPFRRLCPGYTNQPFMGERGYRAGRARECVVVNVPEGGGTLRIELKNQPWQLFITRVRAAVQRTVISEEVEATITGFGDGKQGQEKSISRVDPYVRVSFPSSSTSMKVELKGTTPFETPICMTFTEGAWYKAPPKDQVVHAELPPDGEDPVPRRGRGRGRGRDADADADDGDDDEEDDNHGRRRR